jgi:hypothetical protein
MGQSRLFRLIVALIIKVSYFAAFLFYWRILCLCVRKADDALIYVICTILVDVNPSVLNVESCRCPVFMVHQLTSGVFANTFELVLLFHLSKYLCMVVYFVCITDAAKVLSGLIIR